MNRIVFLDAQTLGSDVSLDPIASLGELTVYQSTSPQDVAERIKDCDVLIVNKIKMGPAQIDSAPHLKLICEAATGTDNIDVEYARSKGIAVRNAKGYSTESVVQTTYMLMLSLVGHCRHFDTYVKSGSYSTSGCFTEVSTPFFELRGKKLGIIGLGNIGSRVAQIASAFGMEVAYFPTSGVAHSNLYPALTLDGLLAQSDIVTIHAPKNSRTDGLIGYGQLAKMKPESYILNMGRGGIVVEEDLARALDEGLIAGAGVDVFTCEPLPADHPYMKMSHKERLVLTPHIAWASLEARTLLVKMIAENIASGF